MRVLVVGDAMLDEFVLCGPGTSSGGLPILIERERVYRPGGAAGVACVAQSLGAEVRLFASLSADDESLPLRICLAGIRFLCRLGCGQRTTRKTRIRCDGQPEIRIDRDEPCRDYRRPVESDMEQADAVILADYAKGALDREERQRVIRLCDTLGVPCVVGAARGVDWSEYAGATAISATQGEARAAGYPSVPPAIYCLTADREGLRLVRGGESHRAAYRVEEVDPLGCGDSVVAALAIGLAERMPLDTLSRFAAAVGACQAGRGPGTQPVSRAEAEALLRQPVSA